MRNGTYDSSNFKVNSEAGNRDVYISLFCLCLNDSEHFSIDIMEFLSKKTVYNTSVSPSPKKGHGKVLKKRALSAHGYMQRGHF